jgi:hypothetical protein
LKADVSQSGEGWSDSRIILQNLAYNIRRLVTLERLAAA